MTGTKDEQPLQLLMRLNSSPSVPLLAKQDWSPVPPPDDALWKKSFNEALSPAMRGAWRKAATELVELAAKVGDWPTIWHNIAVLRTWLADTPGAIAAWQKYSAAADSARRCDRGRGTGAVDRSGSSRLGRRAVDGIWRERDGSVAGSAYRQSRALANADRSGTDGNRGSPPPKGAFWLLDRAVPESGKELAPADVPHVVGQAFIVWQADRSRARLELAAYRTQLTDAQAALAEIAGDSLGEQVKEEISDRSAGAAARC